MNEFEKDLQDVAKPDIQVPIFQQNLRRNLLTKAVAVNPGPSSLGFGLATFCAGLFGAMVILFVVQPEVPNQLHKMIAGETIVAPPVNPAPRYAQTPQANAIPVSNNNLLADKRLSRDADRAFLSNWIRKESPQGISRVKSMTSEGVISFRRFLDEAGNEVVVYTNLNKEEIF